MGEQEAVVKNIDRLPKFIALNGPIGSGKDTVAEYLCIYFEYQIVGFSDPIYEGLYRLNPAVILGANRAEYLQKLVDNYGWDYVKRRHPAVRNMLRIQGTENGRNLHGENCWIDIIHKRIMESGKPRFVFRDLRFPNEADFIHSLGGQIWKIEGRLSEEAENLPDHISEKHYIEPDKVLLNDGTLARLYHRIHSQIAWYLE